MSSQNRIEENVNIKCAFEVLYQESKKAALGNTSEGKYITSFIILHAIEDDSLTSKSYYLPSYILVPNEPNRKIKGALRRICWNEFI